MKAPVLAALVLVTMWAAVSARQQVATQNLFARWYEQNERVSYRMTSTTRDRTGTTTFTATVRGVVKQDEMGRFLEELEWSDVLLNGMPFQIPAANQAFRQVMSLTSERVPSAPDMTRVHPRLAGAAMDLRTFYADAWLAMQQPGLRFTGNRAVLFRNDPTSWADGTRVVLGEDAVDLQFTLMDLNTAEGSASLAIVHENPGQPRIRIPVEWMRTPVAGVTNNWAQVVRAGARQFVASVGAETAEVQLQLSLTNGKIFSGRLESTVEVYERECTDEALAMCGEGVRYQIVRQAAIVQGP